MGSEDPAVGSLEQRARLEHQLAHAERLLADAKSKLLNASAFSDGNSWGAADPRPGIQNLNAEISNAQQIDRLEAAVARLRRLAADR